MALSDEQNAMLRLLASGEQGYGDIAALMGLSEEEVRAKVVGALAQLQAEGKPAPKIPPPIAGGAKPAAEAAPPEPEPPAQEGPQVEPVVADAEVPKAPVAPVPTAPAPAQPASPPPVAPSFPPPSGRPPSGGRTITLPAGRNAWLLGGGIVAAIAVIIVVILLASGGGGNDSSTRTTGTTRTAAENGNGESGAGKEATQADLTAVDGSEAAGRATFGRVKNKLALQVEATGLEPTTEGTDAYAIWLAQSPRRMIPLASTAVKGSGKGANEIAAQFEVPVEVLAYMAKGTFDQIAITRTRTARLEAAIKVATKKKTTPAYTGEPVLRGTITGPIIGIAKREEEEKGQ